MGISRRNFIRYASLAAAARMAGCGPFGALNALAQSSSDYKALVCIMLFGGNDGNNMIIPFDTAGYQNYAALRGPLALAQKSLLPLSRAPRFAVNLNMPEIQTLFDSNRAAFITNVGTLVEPITRATYLAGNLVTPQNLFSHLDQQTIWQSGQRLSSIHEGWGGRIADVFQGSNSSAKYPLVTSVAGAQVFCNGATTSYSSIIPGRASGVSCGEGNQCASRQEAAQQLVTFDSGLTLIQADNQITTNAYNYSAVLEDAVRSVAPIATAFPSGNSLALQLSQIAQVIQARSALGTGRQIFFASLGGFDTHSDQLAIQNRLLAQMSSAMGAFYSATEELGLSQQVTTFTMSDFARTLQPNSASGSDHAWGGHHIAVGGAVKGGEIYGQFPTLALGGPDDAGRNGRWIPTTSASQYAATMASWFGVSDADLNKVFPALSNFSQRNMGFV